MAASGTRALVLRAATAAAPTVFTDFTSAVSTVKITAGESDTDFVSFADAAAGGARQYVLEMTLVQDLTAASLWDYAFSLAGTDVPVEIWPNGRPATTITASQPKISGTVTVVEPDGDFIGGEANPDNTARFTSEFAWKFTAKPTRTITGSV